MEEVIGMRQLAIGIDLGGTQVRAGLIDEDGNILKRAAVATDANAGPAIVTDQLHQLAASICDNISRDHLLGVGVSAAGPLDAENGVVLSTPTLAGFVDVPLARMLKERMDLPVRLENDGFAAALGEWRSGAGRGYQNMVYITVSTGIGGGVILDGRLVRGRRGLAGHVGHMTIVRDGELCACGNRGCWEAYASGPAFARRGRFRAESEAQVPTTLGIGGAPIDGRAIFEAAQRSDRLASSLVLDEADLLGVGIVNLLHLFSPDLVVIGGGMSNGFDLLLPGIAARISSGAMPAFRNIPIVRAALGDNSGLVGAAFLVFDAS